MAYSIKKDDTAPPITATLRDSQGTPIDLTGCTVKFHMKAVPPGTKSLLDKSVSILDGVNGKVRYVWATGDTDTAGPYRAEFEITYPDLTHQTVPSDAYIDVLVVDDLNVV